MKKYLSYSELALWQRDKKQYIDRYVKGLEGETTPQMELGKLIHKVLEEPRYPWVKEAREMELHNKKLLAIRKIITRMSFVEPPQKEYTFRAVNHDPELFAIFDGFDIDRRILYEYKTTEAPKMWNQYKVDRHPQLSFYAYMYFKTQYRFFSDIQLYVCDTKRGSVKTYHTIRGPKDIEDMGLQIEKAVREMKAEGIWEQRVSSRDKALIAQTKLF